MKKSVFGKIGMLALLATAAGAVGVGCSSSQTATTGSANSADGPQGSVGLSLVPVSGVTLNSVHYIVTNTSQAGNVAEGDLPTPGTAKDFTFGLPLPVGTNYTISLSAVSVENPAVTCAGAFGTFNVTANASSAFTLTLACHDNTTGQAIGTVGVTTDACPRIVFDYAVATPASALIGSTIAVAGKAHDLDGKTLTYAWKIATPANGTFAPVTAASSVFTCAAAGNNQVVTVTANNGECSKSLTTYVSCTSATCGNGVIDTALGETCDTALTPLTCPSNCMSHCGNGIVETPAETCEPPNTATCGTTCLARTPVCGDGFLTSPEVCDGTNFPAGTPAGSTCSADCKTITSPAPAVCGNGIVEAGEVCDASDGTCNNTCTAKVSNATCVTCENNGTCSDFVANCSGPGGAFTAAQSTQCNAVLSCIESSNCFDGTGTLGGTCYCGSLALSDCQAAPFDLTKAGAPNGPCAAVIQAGLPGITSNSAVLGGLTASAKPAGAAMQRLNCDKTADGAACLSACGFTTGGPAFP